MPGAVHAVGGHRLERVGDGEDPRLERDLVAGEAGRVAAAVGALVVREHPRGEIVQVRPAEDARAQLRVLLHLGPLGLGERAGLRRIGSGTPIFPRSWSSPASRTRSTRSGSRPRRGRDPLAEPPDRLRVLRGAAVAEVERLGEDQHRGDLLDGLPRVVGAGRQRLDDLLGEDDAAVAAELLGEVERLVGAVQELLARRRVARAARDAEADGHRGVVGEAVVAHRAAQALGDEEPAVLVGVGEHERELLAADAGEVVDQALDVAGDDGEALERLVADAVAEAVVDALEVVEVADDDGDRAARCAAARASSARDPLLEAAAVEQAGERVGPRRVGEAVDEALGAVVAARRPGADGDDRAERQAASGRRASGAAPPASESATAYATATNAMWAIAWRRGRKKNASNPTHT